MRIKFLFVFLLLPFLLFAKVNLPSLISDNMVLQQLSVVRLWGNANPLTKVKIMPSWSGKSVECISDEAGNWFVDVKTPVAGGPYSINFDDGDKIEVKNVYLGEVWLCSGQSNMEMRIKGNPEFGQPVEKYLETVANANIETNVRLFKVEHSSSSILKDDCNGIWQLNQPFNVPNFSAVAYFFALQLYRTLRVPIGIISSTYSGSNIQAWMSNTALKCFPEVFKIKSELPQWKNSHLYNGMIYPLRNYVIKGIVWYQGESNRNNPSLYEKLFPAFVNDWRNLFSKDVPIVYAQIAPYSYADVDKTGLTGVLLREIQAKCESKIKNASMAVLTDIGEEFCIHPSKKIEVGNRLAYLALMKTYNISQLKAEAPRFKSYKVVGNKIELSFDRVDIGLTSYGKPLECFEVSDKDGIYHKAKADIVKGRQILVWSDDVKSPVSVRYAFKNYVKGDLFGCNGMPVSSFRTDVVFNK